MPDPNAAGLWKTIEPRITDPKIRSGLVSLGLNKLASIGSVSGLDGEGIVNRQFVDFGGWPADSEPKPITAADLKPVPDNAEVAAVARFDVGWLYRRVLDAIVQLNPEEHVQEKIEQSQQMLGFQVEADLLASLGDVWTAHTNAGGGMLPLSGLAVTVTVRDQEKLTKVHDKLLALAQGLLQHSPEPPLTIETKTVRAASRSITFSRVGQSLGTRLGRWSMVAWSLRPRFRGLNSKLHVRARKAWRQCRPSPAG